MNTTSAKFVQPVFDKGSKFQTFGRIMFRLIVALILFVTTSFAQKPRDYRQEALSLKKTLLEQHFQPKPIDDHFSAELYDHLLEKLDPDKIYFATSDLVALQKYRTLIDNELNGSGWAFFDLLKATYKKSLERAAASVNDAMQKPFRWQDKEYYAVDAPTHEANEAALKNKWKLRLKYLTLQRLITLHDEAGANNAADFFSKQEPQVRQRVRSSELRTINRILQHPIGFEDYFATLFFHTVTAVVDPHTSYFSSTDMEKFMSMLSVEGYFFGVKFDENDEGHIIVATLVPGSPAWKSGEFHAGDVLISLKWDGHDAVDIHGITLEETDEILEDANHGTLEFTIRKADGLQKTVRLRKEKISLEENFVRSFVLSGAKKIGYISLPDFYTRWGDQTEGARCANDVAKEILKLKKEGIEGLILDIRYNGGGSLWEAMAMAGIFIDEGSLGLIKDKNQAVTILKDINRGTVYDGPLVILVNGHSASASEFLAGAIQDYHRGIIVGSRTFGKATAQEIFPLGQYAATKNIQEAIRQGSGFASITIGRFYRVTGRSTQGKGLVPDIALPDVFEALDYHEEKLPFAFGPDSVSKKTYFKPLAKLPIEEMRRRSAERVDASASFQKLKNIYRWVSEEINEVKEPVLLLWQEFYKTHQEDILQRKALTELSSKPTTLYTVVNNESNQERMMTDEYSVEFIEHWKKKLLHDLYLEEAYAIACDYLTINKP